MNKILSTISSVTILILAILLPYTCAIAQNPEWVVYDTTNSGLSDDQINAIAFDGSGTKWFGTLNEGLISFDGTTWEVYNESNSGLPDDHVRLIAIDNEGVIWTGPYHRGPFNSLFPGGVYSYDGSNWTVYDSSNSGLPDNCVNSIAIEASGTKWFATMDGSLSSFDGTNWTVYDTSNSGLPFTVISSIAIDGNDDKWLGTDGEGLVFFDGTNWTIYNTANSGLPGNMVYTIAIDESGTKWFQSSTWNPSYLSLGVGSFDGTNWMVYNESNSGLPTNIIDAVTVDTDGTKWIATYYGLVKFDGTTWTVYNKSNSGLPNDHVQLIAIDNDGNKWIETYDGLSVFREGGVVGIDDEDLISSQPFNFMLLQNFPNPFNPTTTIAYELPELGDVQLLIYDVRGRLVNTLKRGYQSAGNYQVHWGGINDVGTPVSTGVYFCRLQTGKFSQTIKMVYLR